MKIPSSIIKLSCLLITTFLFPTCNSSNDDGMPEEEQEITLGGNYRGSWDSTTDQNKTFNEPISAKLSFSGSNRSKLVGELFISSDYTSCCGSGANDGTLSMDLDGNTITSFRYNDIIPNCTGTFTGSGTISNDNKTLTIDFTGLDCDGNHVGKFRLTKQAN